MHERKPASVEDEPRLREITLLPGRAEDRDVYPFTVPTIRSLRSLKLDRRVTFLVGENGSGKSTLLEAIAMACGFSAEGGSQNMRLQTTPSAGAVHPLASALRLSWSRKLKRGFFLRAESFFNAATWIDSDPSLADVYGGPLHERSHGESFLALVENRFFPGGLYLLDEPESALSPQRQLTVLAHFHHLMTGDPDTQLVVATHSPILLAYPGARILSFDGERIEPVDYEDVPAVQITRSFLTKPEFWLKRLLADPPA